MVKHISTLVNKKPIQAITEPYYPDHVKEIADYVFKQLAMIKSGWRAGFKTKDEVIGYKKQLLLAMHENGIDNFQKIELGLKNARSDENPFMPSTGKFISWCKDPKKITGELNAGMYQEYRPEKLLSNKTDSERRAEAREQLNKIKMTLKNNKKVDIQE